MMDFFDSHSNSVCSFDAGGKLAGGEWPGSRGANIGRWFMVKLYCRNNLDSGQLRLSRHHLLVGASSQPGEFSTWLPIGIFN